MSKAKKFSEQDKTVMLKSLKEGKVQTISKDILGDQKTIQVGSNVEDKAKVEDTKSFEEFKQIYKNTIDDRCMQDYGSIDDKKLWEDCAKEMYLQSENYIPSEEDKPVEDLDSKQLKEESKKYKVSDQEIDDLYDRMRDFAKKQLKIKNETQLDNYMEENMPLWIEIYQGLHSCNESKSLNENLDVAEITWDNMNEYNTEEQHKIIDILNNLDLEVVDSEVEDGTISIGIKDKFSGITFWMDYTKDSEGDLTGDWSQYIFHKSNTEDKIKKAIQSSYNKNTNETIAFDQFDGVAYDYIEQNNLNKITESKYIISRPTSAGDLYINDDLTTTFNDNHTTFNSSEEAQNTLNKYISKYGLSDPKGLSYKVTKLEESVQDQVSFPLDSKAQDKYKYKTVKDTNGTFFTIYKINDKFYDVTGNEVTEDGKDIKTESKQTNIEELKDDILSCDFIDYIQEIVDNLQDEKLKQECNDCIQQLTKWFGTPKNSKQLEPYKVCLYRILDTYKMEESKKLQEDQYEAERRKGRPSPHKIATIEYYDNENYYKAVIKDVMNMDDEDKENAFINYVITDIGADYNLDQDTAIKVCTLLYNLCITNNDIKLKENAQKQANLTDGVKKQVAQQYIEENREALEQCKGLKDIIDNHLKTICTKYCVLQPVGKDICAYIYNILNSNK